MALQRHILVLHHRKRQNANTMWVMVLGCLTLCSFSTLCLLLNDWSLLPQAYNPKPLIFGEALFDLGPDLFPIHPQKGKWNKLVNETKPHSARVVKRCNDGSCFSFLNNIVRFKRNENPSRSRSITQSSSSNGSIERMQREDGLAIINKSMLSPSSGSGSISSIRSSKSMPELSNSSIVKKRSLTQEMPTRSSLRPKDKSRHPNPKERRVSFGGKSEISIPDSPRSSSKKSSAEIISHSKPIVLYSAPPEQAMKQDSLSSHHRPAIKSPSTSSKSSSTVKSDWRKSSDKQTASYNSPQTKNTNKSKFSFFAKPKSRRYLQKRGILEKRAKKRKIPSYASSGESYIRTANHNARYGTSTSAIAPSKKLKQKAPRRDPGSPSHLRFSDLQINSNAAGAGTIASSSSRSSSQSRDSMNSITERPPGLQRLRSDSLRSTGSSAFRRLEGSPPRFHTSPQVSRPGSPASPSAHSDQWWQNDATSSSSGGTTTFFYR